MSQAIDSVTGALQGLQFSSSGSKAADIPTDIKSPANNRSGLLSLPNELLIQVAENLTASKGVGIPAGSTQDLAHLALVCKHLLPITNTVLYQSVTLQAPDQRLPQNGSHRSVLPRFLRTILQHPALGDCVEEVTLYFTEDKLVHPQLGVKKEEMCTCGDCAKMLSGIFHSMRLPMDENIAWQKVLSNPSEAMVCSLILASLPNLSSVALHRLDKIPTPEDPYDEAPTQVLSDVRRLGHGLIGTKVQTIALSGELNGLRLSRLPNLTKLTVDFTGPNPFVWADIRNLVNITALTIKWSGKDTDGQFLDRKLDWLLLGLPNLRTFEIESGLVANLRSIPRHVDMVIFRNADWHCLDKVQSQLNGPAGLKKLRSIVLHMEKDKAVLDTMALNLSLGQKLVEKTGVRVVVMSRGTVWKTLYKTSLEV